MTKEYATQLKRWRQGSGYTQTQIAHDMSMSNSNISRFERGDINNADILLWYLMRGAPLPDEEEDF